ncbi:MAG: alpha/beta fold hydrolase [Pseudomonadota bacterium]
MKRLSVKLAAAAFALLPLASHADTYVLVHGAFQDASGWAQVADALRSEGHTVTAIDLPGRDAEGAAAQAITLQDHIDATVAAVGAADEPVILVGHSFGGMIISGAAEAAPDRIERLVYLAAYVPQSGESMEKLALSDKDNSFQETTFVIAKDYSHATLLPEHQVQVFAQDATDDQAATLQASMIREPLAPMATPVVLTDESFGSVKKAYVRTLDDRTVSTPLQNMMIDRAGISVVRDIQSGHAPYLTQPEALAAALLDLR